MGTFSETVKQAKDWRWRCPACEKTSESTGAGGFVFRIGTSGTTRSLGRCSGCDAWRMLILERASDPLPPEALNADQERTWSELIAYVSEGTMSAEVASQIAQSSAPETRKREVAAHVAEKALTPEQAMTMLGV
ncbi:MAG: hypothetical protein AABZ53_05335 [Planctomycetota bacterium]